MTFIKKLIYVLSGCLLLLSVAGYVQAQSTGASVSGQVLDSSGAVLPSATVEIINNDTNVKVTTETNKDGIYSIPNLKPATYRIQVSRQGFRSVVKPNVVLNVQTAAAINFTLLVGAISEIVTVDAGTSMINTTDASVSTVIDSSYVQNMPLNGRSFQDLILLTPGVVTQSAQSSLGIKGLGQTGEFSVNGQRTESNYYTVDGVSANVGAVAGSNMLYLAGASGSLPAGTALGTTQALVSVDDLQEFRVQSSTYSAEYGRNPGGQFAFETKSGSNRWHGTAYDYLRNDYFDANDWFNDYLGKSEPPLRQNDFGGTLGGPVGIPRLYDGKDKAFFFFSYEGLRLLQPQPAVTAFVPDLCMRGTGTCPSGRGAAASALLPVLNAFPLPSLAGIEDAANGFGQFIGTWSNPSSLDSLSIRFDNVINDKLRLFFRFSNTGSDAMGRSIFTPTLQNRSSYTTRTYTAGATSALSSRLNNELRFNYSSNEAGAGESIDSFGGGAPIDLARIANAPSGASALVNLFYGGYQVVLSQSNMFSTQKQWNLVDTVSLSLGRHQFKFGVDYRRLTPFVVPVGFLGEYFFVSESRVEANHPISVVQVQAPAYPLYTNISTFVQDEWKVSPRLSLSLGLRWEVNPAPGVTQGLKPYTIQGSNPNNWALAPQGVPLWRTSWYNFAPRSGVAYILRSVSGWETVLRGGGGVFFDTGQQLGSAGFTGPGFTAGAVSFSPPLPFPVLPPTPSIVNPPIPPYGLSVFGFSDHLQLPYTLQWNASVEQALGKSQALTLSYVGSHGARLLEQVQFYTPTNPNGGVFVFSRNGAASDYDSAQIQFRRRLSRGLTVLASYTWSHCIDYGSVNYTIGYQRGNCDFDVRNNFSSAFSYDLPNIGHERITSAVLHHWGLDNRFTARSGFPISLNGAATVDPVSGNQTSTGLYLISGQPIYLYGTNCNAVYSNIDSQAAGHAVTAPPCPGGRAINPCAFALPSSPQPYPSCPGGNVAGVVAHNFVRGFGAWQMDMAVRREFLVFEDLKLQFRAEAFNILNHPSFGNIDNGFGSLTFGQPTATLAQSLGVLSPLYQAGGPRSLQFALKLVF